MEQNPSTTRALSQDEYNKVVELVTSDLFSKNETFRNTVVHRELSAIVLKWATWIGVANLLALVGIFFGVKSFMQQAVADEASKVVKSHTEWIEESVRTISGTAVAQLATMQSELATSQKTLAKSHEQVSGSLKQADEITNKSRELQVKLREVANAQQAIAANAIFLNDPANIQRTAAFIKLLAEDKNAKPIADLATQLQRVSRELDDLANWVYKPLESGKTLEEVKWIMSGNRNLDEAMRQRGERFQQEAKRAAENAERMKNIP